MKNDDKKLVEIWPIDRPTPNPHNARVHSDEQVAELAASLREYKFTRPLLVDENDVLLAGHGTLQAARHLGLQEVPVIVIAHLTELQKRAYMIADNQLALNSEWDEEKLGRELAELERELVDLKMVGFSPEELDRLLADLAPECLVDEDSVPPPPRIPITVPGELWLLGKHRVLCGDALSAENLDRVMQGRSAAMVFSDFPYNVNYEQKSSRSPARPIANDNLGAQFEEFLRAACVEILRVTEGAVYLCMSSSELHTATPRVHRRRWALVNFCDVVEGSLHGRTIRLPATVRANSLWLEGGPLSFLVWSAEPGRCVVRAEATDQFTAPHHEAGGFDRAGNPQ